MLYSHNFMLISLKVTIIFFDKFPFLYSKFADLITTILHLIILFKSEVDSNKDSLKTVYTTAVM